MKERTKGFIAGFLLCALLIGLGVPAAASTYKKAAEIYYRDIKVTVDGTQVTPKDANGNTVEPFIMNGTTYLPVRGIASALGMNVSWDNATSTVKLSAEGTTSTIMDVPELLNITGNNVWSDVQTAEIIHGDTDTEQWKYCISFLGDGTVYAYQYSTDSNSAYGLQGEYNIVDGYLNIVYQIDYDQDGNERDIYKVTRDGEKIVLDYVSGNGHFCGEYEKDESWTQYEIRNMVNQAFHRYDDAPYR